MPNLSVKNVPTAVVARLRRRARRNHRSLQGELMAVVCRAAEEPAGQPTATAPIQPTLTGTRTVEQIAAENRARRKQPIAQGPYAVDIIRAARDAR